MADPTAPGFNPNMQPVPRNQNLVRPPPPDHPYFAPQRPEASWERLQEPSSRVKVTNTAENGQMHVVIDRFLVGHELRPGQSVEVEMINDEIARFQEMRRADRYYPATDPARPLRPKPLHPIKIEGVGSMIEEAAERYDDRQRALAAEREAMRAQAMQVPKGKGKV
jgi:hypothetical protein